jgi:hypothetical protein
MSERQALDDAVRLLAARRGAEDYDGVLRDIFVRLWSLPVSEDEKWGELVALVHALTRVAAGAALQAATFSSAGMTDQDVVELIHKSLTEDEDEAAAAALTCTECERPWIGDELGWKAYRADLDELALYCPECAEEEFSDA